MTALTAGVFNVVEAEASMWLPVGRGLGGVLCEARHHPGHLERPWRNGSGNARLDRTLRHGPTIQGGASRGSTAVRDVSLEVSQTGATPTTDYAL